MSYIKAHKVDFTPEPAASLVSVPGYDMESDIHMDADFEQYPFLLRLIAAVEELGEDEALVIWKEIS